MSDDVQKKYEKDEIINIGKWQRVICWLFLAILIGYLLIFAGNASRVLVVFREVLLIGGSITAVVCVYFLSKALKVPHPLFYVFGMLISIVRLFVLCKLITDATKILKENKIGVGIMGARKEDLTRFLAGSC